jgi:hypothetical protein
VVVFPDGYLQEAYRIVRGAGGVCIADEVQAGFGRTGTHYWGFETQGVIPDIVTMAKSIGNGAPLAAVVTTPEIAATLAQRIHFNTFGGNPFPAPSARRCWRSSTASTCRPGASSWATPAGRHAQADGQISGDRRRARDGPDGGPGIGEGPRHQGAGQGGLRAACSSAARIWARWWARAA